MAGVEKIRIGLISADFFPNVGGIAAHVSELGRSLVRAGHDVHVVTLPRGKFREAEANFHGVRVHRPATPKMRPIYTWFLHYWLKNSGILQELDILHVHGMRPIEASKNLDIPVIFSNHTSGFVKRMRALDKNAADLARRLQHFDHIVTASETLADATRATGYGGPVEFIANGVDSDRFCPGPSPQRAGWKLAKKHAIVLLARRLTEVAGTRYFAEAVTLLKNDPVSFVIAGDGPERRVIEAVLQKSDMLERCCFLGSVANADMPDVYRGADISLLPSLIEATSITGLESMASGLPLIGTRVGGIPSILADGETGILVPPKDAVALAAAIRRLVEDPKLASRFGKAGRKRAVAEFDWQVKVKNIIEIYRRYIKSN